MVVCQTRPTTRSTCLCPLPRFFLLNYLIGIELPKLDSISKCGKSGCFDSMLCNISIHDDNEVFSISKTCEVGKINNDNRIRKKNVAKITIINTTAIIKIKIPVVFTLIIFKLASIKVLRGVVYHLHRIVTEDITRYHFRPQQYIVCIFHVWLGFIKKFLLISRRHLFFFIKDF